MELKLGTRTVFALIIVFLLLLAITVLEYYRRAISYEAARVLIEALSVTLTLTVLFSAFLSLEATRKNSVASSELAVKPSIVWNFRQAEGGLFLDIENHKNDAFDFRMHMEADGEKATVRERHLEISALGNKRVYSVEMGEFFKKFQAGQRFMLGISESYVSTLGGRYHYTYHKEMGVGKGGKILFSQRRIASAKLPWLEKPIKFNDD